MMPRKISETARFDIKIVDRARFFMFILWMKTISMMFKMIIIQALAGLMMTNVMYALIFMLLVDAKQFSYYLITD